MDVQLLHGKQINTYKGCLGRKCFNNKYPLVLPLWFELFLLSTYGMFISDPLGMLRPALLALSLPKFVYTVPNLLGVEEWEKEDLNAVPALSSSILLCFNNCYS